MRLVFCGFMGAGKTKLGRLCARNLGLGFHDLDAAIVEKAGMSVAEFFKTMGEEAFRAMESEMLESLLQTDNRVLSVGGGAIGHIDAIDRIKAANLVIWVDVPLETVFARVIGDARRPLANAPGSDDASRTALTELFARRRPIYERAQIHFRPQPDWYPEESATRLTQLIRRHVHAN